MEKLIRSNQARDFTEHHHAEETVKLIFRGLIPVVFLVSGVVILGLKLPGWSLFIGLPLTIFGTVFLIYSYDEILGKKLGIQDYKDEEKDY